jgi:hypothetical protein
MILRPIESPSVTVLEQSAVGAAYGDEGALEARCTHPECAGKFTVAYGH